MTAGSKLHQALSQAESLKAQLETFGHDTQDPKAKTQFYQMAQAVEQHVVGSLRSRVNYVEAQEPQYKVKQQAAQQAGARPPVRG